MVMRFRSYFEHSMFIMWQCNGLLSSFCLESMYPKFHLVLFLFHSGAHTVILWDPIKHVVYFRTPMSTLWASRSFWSFVLTLFKNSTCYHLMWTHFTLGTSENGPSWINYAWWILNSILTAGVSWPKLHMYCVID